MIYEGNKFIAFEVEDLVKIENEAGVFQIRILNNEEATLTNVKSEHGEMRIVPTKDLAPAYRWDAALEFYPEIKKLGLGVHDYNCSWMVDADRLEEALRRLNEARDKSRQG